MTHSLVVDAEGVKRVLTIPFALRGNVEALTLIRDRLSEALENKQADTWVEVVERPRTVKSQQPLAWADPVRSVTPHPESMWPLVNYEHAGYDYLIVVNTSKLGLSCYALAGQDNTQEAKTLETQALAAYNKSAELKRADPAPEPQTQSPVLWTVNFPLDGHNYHLDIDVNGLAVAGTVSSVGGSTLTTPPPVHEVVKFYNLIKENS